MPARCMAEVPVFLPLVLTSKFSIKAIPFMKFSQVSGRWKDLALRVKGLKILFLLSIALLVLTKSAWAFCSNWKARVSPCLLKNLVNLRCSTCTLSFWMT